MVHARRRGTISDPCPAQAPLRVMSLVVM